MKCYRMCENSFEYTNPPHDNGELVVISYKFWLKNWLLWRRRKQLSMPFFNNLRSVDISKVWGEAGLKRISYCTLTSDTLP